MNLSRREVLVASIAACTVHRATAQARKVLPATIKMVVPYGPGGAIDGLSRILSDRLQYQLDITVIVENRPGAGGRIAMAQIRRASPDGSEIIIAPNGLTTLQSLVYAKQIGYNVATDFAPIARVGRNPIAITVSAASPINSAQDLKSWVLANPGRANFGSAAAGGMNHFAGLVFAKAGGFTWTHVAFKSGAELVNNVLGGHIVAAVGTLDRLEFIRAGKVRVVGIFSAERFPLAPFIPTLHEQGFKTPVAEGWMSALAPKATDPDIVLQLQEAFRRVLEEKEVRERMGKLGIDGGFLTASSVHELQIAELKTWAPIVQDANFVPE